MDGSSLLLRCKAACIRHGPALVALFALVALLGFGGAAWAYTHPPTDTITEQTHRQAVATTVNGSAVVTGNTSLWDRGTVLREKPFYPLPAAPNYTVRVTTTVPGGQAVHVEQRLSLGYRAGEGGSSLWETRREVASRTATVEDGTAILETTIDVGEVRAQRDRFNEELVGIDRAEVFLALSVRYETDRYAGNLTATAPLAVGANRYSLDGSLDASRVHTTPVTREVPRPREGSYLYLLAVGFLGLAGAAVARRVHLAGGDPEAVRDAIQRARFAEWISQGRLNRSIEDRDVPIRTLPDLVDVAIDSKRRVVFDPVRDLYAVVDDGTIYYYHAGVAEEFDDEPADAPESADRGPSREGVLMDTDANHNPWSDLVTGDAGGDVSDPPSDGGPPGDVPDRGESGGPVGAPPAGPADPSARPERILPDGSRDAWKSLMGERPDEE